MSLAPLTAGLAAPHGFFTREGGVSSGVYASLNCGAGSSDRAEAVARNRARVAAHLGVPPEHLRGVHQVHSAEAVAVAGAADGAPPRADGLVSADPEVALAVLTADCGPLLMLDPGAGVAGAAHAGWAGALGGIVEATVIAMEALGAERGRIRAVLGPTIGPDSYEVGPEFAARFESDDPANARFFAPGTGDRARFDLPGYVLARLGAAGVRGSWTGHDTYAEPGRFFSYRRSVHERAPDYGRLISAIRPAKG